jgi:formylglycine-generating enzyme required for sulfatase activity
MKVRKFRKLWLVAGVFAAVGISHLIPRQANAQTTAPEVGSVFRDCPNCPEMIVIPAGKFMMGSSPEETDREVELAPGSFASTIQKVVLTERPLHEVTIDLSFALAKFPVTKNEFSAFVDETGYTPAAGCRLYALQYHISPQADWRLPGFAQTERDPVVCISWQDAKAYIEWLNKKILSTTNSAKDRPYRLPSEADWEYAARAGTRTARWWGDFIGRNNANCARCGSRWDQRQTSPVGSFPPNPFGLYDILGNVTQWTEDCWNESYIDAPIDGAPWVKGNCQRRLARGGDFAGFPWLIRSATRFGLNAEDRVNLGGFRVAKTLGNSSQ